MKKPYLEVKSNKSKMQDLIIAGSILEELHTSPTELMNDFAVYLYDKEKLSIGQAKKLAGLTQIEFQKEMAKRDVLIKYDTEDLEKDLETLRQLD